MAGKLAHALSLKLSHGSPDAFHNVSVVRIAPTNGSIGFELFNLSASAAISSLSVHVPAEEDSEFAIGDVTFAIARVPEPATIEILPLSMSGLLLARRQGRLALP